MNFLSLIESKRDGHPLTAEQIHWFITEYVAGKIPDYQMSALLMAVYYRGLSTEETSTLTLAMRDSGEKLTFPKDSRPLVDKHSTGGVGDKVSLPLAPLLACLGFRVPMISGRGLGITGGTLDKLESIPGFKTALPVKDIVAQVQRVGCVICGQTDTMVPADKKIYALRDVSGTVPSIPLITASILSKKLAESLDALILDVKFGSAAFMQTKKHARDLAKSMVNLGKACGVNTRAILTNMNVPLGRAAGNWLEVKESVECLEGKGPSDLTDLTIRCAAELLVQTNQEKDLAKATARATKTLKSGAPKAKWDEMIKAQGADMEAYRRKLTRDHTSPVIKELYATERCFVKTCDARVVGEIVRDIGGGRLNKDTKINFDVGVDQLAKPGKKVQPNSVLGRIHAATACDAEAALIRLKRAFTFSKTSPAAGDLVQEAF